MAHSMKGKVYLVGAGPGDPALITLRGLECIRMADVVVYDYLAADQLLHHRSENAEVIYVGKKGGDHTLSQNKINDLIVEKAEQGLVVTRLKGGDPFIFGRGGEEAEILAARNIPFEIVPGVTSAIAAPAYAGIPLTHREHTTSVSFITGHEDPTKEQSTIHWQALAETGGTLVFLMGVKNLSFIVDRLMEHGRPGTTPAALVRWGTTPMQQTVTGTLDTIVDRVKAAGLQAPCIIVIGGVVNLRETIAWFEASRPLLGKTIVVTRARAQASDFIAALSRLGAACIECPTIRVAPPDDTAPLDTAIDNLAAYDWLVFTSVNGVDRFFARLFEKGGDVRRLGHLKTAVIGPATEQRLLDFGVKSDIVPESFRAESVVEAFTRQDVKGKSVLLPRAAEARPILPEELTKMGARVDEVAAYVTRQDDSAAKTLTEALESGAVDMVTFTSSSTVKNFKALLPKDKSTADRLIKNVAVASIGPITTETAKDEGFAVHVTADAYTIEGLTRAIIDYFKA
ncbi:uroporphyrin-III C-methyltransferase [Desulfosudis oleivorans Hxd3]|uniref:uroporphyrinogen-III C-methyltransferase n=2 Tax=Desulfosudis TaxID=2904716 RepID=A8ZZJ3_DESOH|nr:uroporphyrin-III C-methyltransferase [Desulfosudis oleivorans Hxd3]